MEILCVSMECIRSEQADSIVMIGIGTGKVADIDKRTEIGMINRVDKLFNTVGILSEEAMVFDTGFNSLCFSIFGYCTICLCKNGKNMIEASSGFNAYGIAGGCIVTDHGATVSLGDVNKALNALDFGIEIAVEEICAHAEAKRLNADAFAIIADILCISLISLEIVGILRSFDKIDTLCAKLFNFIDTSLYSKGFIIAVKAIKTNAYFHANLPINYRIIEN